MVVIMEIESIYGLYSAPSGKQQSDLWSTRRRYSSPSFHAPLSPDTTSNMSISPPLAQQALRHLWLGPRLMNGSPYQGTLHDKTSSTFRMKALIVLIVVIESRASPISLLMAARAFSMKDYSKGETDSPSHGIPAIPIGFFALGKV